MKETEQISQELKAKAVKNGLCQKWTSEWVEGLSKQSLIDRYIDGLDFCIEHNYPSNEYIKNNFEPELLHENNIYVDEEFSLSNRNGFVVMNGKCKGRIIATGGTASTIYVRHDSKLELGTGDVSAIFVHLYDNASAVIMQSMGSKVRVYLHSDNCQLQAKGEVVVRRRENKEFL